MATETKVRDVFKEIGKYPDSPCHLCGMPGTHYFPDSGGAWVCEDAPHCNDRSSLECPRCGSQVKEFYGHAGGCYEFGNHHAI